MLVFLNDGWAYIGVLGFSTQDLPSIEEYIFLSHARISQCLVGLVGLYLDADIIIPSPTAYAQSRRPSLLAPVSVQVTGFKGVGDYGVRPPDPFSSLFPFLSPFPTCLIA